jgi:hypothetical protein
VDVVKKTEYFDIAQRRRGRSTSANNPMAGFVGGQE